MGRIKFLIYLLTFFIGLSFTKSVSASTLTLSPSSGNIAVGSTLSIQIRLNTGGEGVNGVSAYLSYPQDKLDIAWMNFGSSAFSIAAEGTSGGGVIKISRGNINAVSGNINVATIGLKGRAPGAATVSFIGGSAVPRASDSSDSLNLGASRGGTYNVGGSAPPPSSVGSKTPSKDQTPPTISDINVLEISTNSAKINWKTNEKADSYVEYGIDPGVYILNISDNKLVTNHSLMIQNPLFLPGSKIYYKIKSKNSLNNQASSPESTLQLKGYSVKITVKSNNKPLEGAEVSLYSEPVKALSNNLGEVNFDNISPGKHLVSIKYQTQEKTSEIQVLPQDNLQNFDVSINTTQRFGNLIKVKPVYLILGALIFLSAVIIVIFLIKRKRSGLSTTFYDPNP